MHYCHIRIIPSKIDYHYQIYYFLVTLSLKEIIRPVRKFLFNQRKIDPCTQVRARTRVCVCVYYLYTTIS